MSYSRWGESYWYTYWCVADADIPETRATAIFEICMVTRFRASEIRKDISACVAKAALICKNAAKSTSDGPPYTVPSESDLLDLTRCMEAFLRDVDAKYPISHKRKRHG